MGVTLFGWNMRPIIVKGIDITKRFPNIIKRCNEEGYDQRKSVFLLFQLNTILWEELKWI